MIDQWSSFLSLLCSLEFACICICTTTQILICTVHTLLMHIIRVTQALSQYSDLLMANIYLFWRERDYTQLQIVFVLVLTHLNSLPRSHIPVITLSESCQPSTLPNETQVLYSKLQEVAYLHMHIYICRSTNT